MDTILPSASYYDRMTKEEPGLEVKGEPMPVCAMAIASRRRALREGRLVVLDKPPANLTDPDEPQNFVSPPPPVEPAEVPEVGNVEPAPEQANPGNEHVEAPQQDGS